MSSRSSFVVISLSLHLVEGFGERGLEPERLLDLFGRDIGIFAVLEEARAMVIAHELDEALWVCIPVLRESFEILEDRDQARRAKEGYCVLGVLVEVGVEDTDVLEIGVALDLEEIPAQVVQLERRERIRLFRDGLLDVLRVRVAVLLLARNDLCDDRKAVAGRALRKDWSVAALLDLVLFVSAFRDRL